MTKAPGWALSFNINNRCKKGAEWPPFFFCCLDILDMSYRNNVDFVFGNYYCFGLRQPLQAVVGMNFCVLHYLIPMIR